MFCMQLMCSNIYEKRVHECLIKYTCMPNKMLTQFSLKQFIGEILLCVTKYVKIYYAMQVIC